MRKFKSEKILPRDEILQPVVGEARVMDAPQYWLLGKEGSQAPREEGEEAQDGDRLEGLGRGLFLPSWGWGSFQKIQA